MRRRMSLLLCCFLLGGAAFPAHAADSTSVAFRGRFDAFVNIDDSHSPFSWNHNSRSPDNRTRLMTDLLVTRERLGEFYVKGAATWAEVDDVNARVAFALEQGDYLWRHSAERYRVGLRAFANERRFFTYEMSAPLLDDDRMALYDNRWGLRAAGDTGGGIRWSYLGAALDDHDVSPRVINHLQGGYYATHIQASMSYLYDRASRDVADRSVVKAEVSAFYKRATAIVSYAQSGLDDALPSGSFDGDGSGGYAATAPENSATFAEVRVADVRTGDRGRLDFSYRYNAIGSAFVNDLAPGRPGEIRNIAGAYWSHRTLAVDTRLVYDRRVRHTFIDSQTENVAASARAFFRDGMEAFVRGGVGSRDDGFVLADDYFVHAALRRAERRFDTAVHAMLSDAGRGVRDRYAAEARLRTGATSALYGRVILDDTGGGRASAVLVRLEFRPTRRVFATFGYGPRDVGDGPFLLEDRDINLVADPGESYTFTVRADF